MVEFKTTSPEMTEKFGELLSDILMPGDTIALDGDLGAGKTCLTRGISRGMKASGHVSSPTFTIVNEYDDGRLPLFHFDTYRLSDEEDFLMSGLDEYFDRGGVCIIEWSDIIKGVLPENTIKIRIKGNGEDRNFEIEASSDFENKIKEIIGKIV